MGELESRSVRVSGDGTIALPFAGVIEVQGYTESEVKEELRRRLLKYKRDPQVSLFVREYRSRLVAVAGAVEKPGLYSVASTTNTLLDVISQAGGMTKEALPQILLLPAEAGGKTGESRLASPAVPVRSAESGGLSPVAAQSTDPLVIDLHHLRKGKQQLYLTLPVRPGDALIIPSGGEIVVGGWVDKPGSYKITPGLTVLGAVTAAGDTLFPADTRAVKVIRTDTTGEQQIFSADLKEIARGESLDIPVQEGDVIEVNPSTVKLVSYGMFNFFRSVFTFGAQMRPY
jgi:polysaccharide export outer membrane protein